MISVEEATTVAAVTAVTAGTAMLVVAAVAVVASFLIVTCSPICVQSVKRLMNPGKWMT